MVGEFASFETWAMLGEHVPFAVIATDHAGIVRVWSPGAEELYGWSQGAALGCHIQSLTVGPLEQEVASEIMERVMSGETWEGNFHARRQDGSLAEVHVVDIPMSSQGASPVGIVGLSFAVIPTRNTDRMKSLRLLADEIYFSRQEERSLIARELHDGVGQMLTAARSHLLGIMNEAATTNGAFGAGGKSVEYIDRALDGIKAISGGLLEPRFDIWQLILRIIESAEDFQIRTGVLVSVDIGGTIEELRQIPDSTARIGFHIVREAMTNCERHAKASHIQVLLAVDGEGFTVTVTDNGIGISENADGIGLRIMRDRIQQVGGSISMSNVFPNAAHEELTSGTRVHAVIPVLHKIAKLT